MISTLGPTASASPTPSLTPGRSRRIPDAHVLAKTLLNTFEVGYPFVRRQAYSVRGSVGMDYVNQDVRLNHALDLTRDRLRVGFVRLGLDTQKTDFDNAGYSLAEPPWRANAILELRQGMHILGATDCGAGFADCTAPATSRRAGSKAGPTRRCFATPCSAKLRPMPEAHARARRSRSICVEAAAELRGILGRQLHRRPRL